MMARWNLGQQKEALTRCEQTLQDGSLGEWIRYITKILAPNIAQYSEATRNGSNDPEVEAHG